MEQLAIDLPKFMESSSQDKAKTLLRIIGIGDRLSELEVQLRVFQLLPLLGQLFLQLPLPGLSVDEGELVYNGQKWDCMSGSDRLKVATAIVRKLTAQSAVSTTRVRQTSGWAFTYLACSISIVHEDGVGVLATSISFVLVRPPPEPPGGGGGQGRQHSDDGPCKDAQVRAAGRDGGL